MPKMRTTPVESVETCHKLLLWLVPHLDKFPRNRRLTLGERRESTLLMVMEEVIEASYSREKQASLHRANRRLAVARHLWRLCHELQVISTRRYEHGAQLDWEGFNLAVQSWIGHAQHAETEGLRPHGISGMLKPAQPFYFWRLP